ncbi:hypothetical protein SAMN05192555_103139 [Franzmannia pantelleriensis]|uniref:Uncharacterized protein n=1 Tax=Franzmannia pantelleriensis TaxID=48727 RepID=A0A1G9ICZ4_9GAMM|nr:hypothetical protein [Halomonas pantelleriensis]SDL23100.1 hypothetical protein SAMN05192555_103139 [Halomonas pantelleriensis]
MTIKDWVTLIAAIIATILSIWTFSRTLSLERKMRYEPYFQRFWFDWSTRMSSHLKLTNDWLSRFEKEESSSGFFPNVSSRDVDIKLDEQAARFDRIFSRVVEKYEIKFNALKAEVVSFNKLLYPISEEYAIYSSVGEPEDIQRMLRESVWPVVDKYLGSHEEKKIVDLKSDRKYKRDLAVCKEKVKKCLTEFRSAHNEMSCHYKLLSAKYDVND